MTSKIEEQDHTNRKKTALAEGAEISSSLQFSDSTLSLEKGYRAKQGGKLLLLVLFNGILAAGISLLANALRPTWNVLQYGVFLLVALCNFLLLKMFFPRDAKPAQPEIQYPLFEDVELSPASLGSSIEEDELEELQTEVDIPLALSSSVTPAAKKAAALDEKMRRFQTFQQMLSQKEIITHVTSSALSGEQRRLINETTQRVPVVRKAATPRTTALKIVLLVMLLAVTVTIWIHAQPWFTLIVLALSIAITYVQDIDIEQSVIMGLAVTVTVAIVDYLTWRFRVTNWAGWWIALPLLAAETLGAIHTLGFQYTLWPRRRPNLELRDDPTVLPIFIFIPTVNEGNAVLEPTIQGALTARKRYLDTYPHAQVNIIICNDGRVAGNPNWQDAERLASRLGVTCITRTVGGGAKAGNIEHARQQVGATGKSLIVIFDADQVAKENFLLNTVLPFSDATIGWVQTGQYYRNLENPVTRWADDQQALFYRLLCPGKASLNAVFICGTNVVIRAEALDEIGGLPQDSVTEDFSASITLHARWRSIFLKEVLATGLGPMDLPSYLKQQRRWAIGTLGVFRSHWPMLFLPKRSGLSLEQRVQYFLACTHYLCGLRDLLYLLSPVLFLLTGIPAVQGSTLEVFLQHFLSYALVTQAAFWFAGRGVTGMRGVVIGFGSFPVLIESLLSVVLQRKIGFTVTAKQRGTGRSINHLLVYIFFLVLCFACLFLAMRFSGSQQVSMFISVLWIVYFIFMLGAVLFLGIQDMRFQGSAQEEQVVPAIQEYVVAARRAKTGSIPWREGLAAGLAFFALFTSGYIDVPISSPAPFMLTAERHTAPYAGISLPVQLLKGRPRQLEQKLKHQFGIIGRVQDVHDFFDRAWADELAEQGQRPWITLQFGTFDASGKPPLDASLLAISNGLHDSLLQRWARDIRDYGKPVYITILQHVDRNWSLSSAVANGGIPQDVAPAWRHVQAVFQANNAKNVAWVWAPADPAHDEKYAPPEKDIDAVLLSLISYPQTRWVEPAEALQQVVKRHAHTPILLEASVAGPADEKAAWLNDVSTAVHNTPNVYAFIYHEGAPDLHASQVLNAQWSMLSDRRSAETIRQLFKGTSKLPQ